MRRYSPELKVNARRLRAKGETYREISESLMSDIPKSTLSTWCKGVAPPEKLINRLSRMNSQHLHIIRIKAVEANKQKHKAFIKHLQMKNWAISKKVSQPDYALIALAMLCLGEATKYPNPFSLGSSDPKIITLFLNLLAICFDMDREKLRCTVQCRSDQVADELEGYWAQVTGIPRNKFYKARVDPRTRGKPTTRVGYKGVLRVNYLDTKVQQEIEMVAQMMYNEINKTGP